MGINGTALTQEDIDALKGNFMKGQAEYKATGTYNNSTPEQNLAAVYNQKGNTAPITPYIQQTLNTAASQQNVGNTAPPPPGGSTTTGSSSSGSTQPTDNGLGNAQDYINQLNDLRKNASLSALQKSHDAALSNMGAEKSAIQPKYYDQRNQVAAGAQQQARNFQEFMNARGGGSSGANAQATLSNNASLQGNLGSLGRQEAAAYTDIERRTSDLNNAYQSDIASATTNAESEKMQMLYQEYVRAQTRGDTLAQNQIQNAMQQTQLEMQKQNQGFTQNLQTNQFNQGVNNDTFNQNLATKQYDYNVATDSRDFDYKKAQDSWSQTFAKEQYNDQKAAQLWEQTFKTKTFEQDMKDAAAARGLQWASLNQRDKEFIADSAYREKTYTAGQDQLKIDNQLNQDKLSWDKDPLNLDNISKNSDIAYKDSETAKNNASLNQAAPVDAKTSTNNYTSAVNQLKAKKGITNADATAYLKAIAANVTDSDYKALSEWISKNIVK